MLWMDIYLTDLADSDERAGALKRLKNIASSSSDWPRLSLEEKAQRQAKGKAAFDASDEGKKYASQIAWQAYEASMTPEALEAELVEHLEAILHSNPAWSFSDWVQCRTDIEGSDEAKRMSEFGDIKAQATKIGWHTKSVEEKAGLQAASVAEQKK
jgi:hypothetical protein